MYEYKTTDLLAHAIHTRSEANHIKEQTKNGWKLLSSPAIKPENEDDYELAIYYWERKIPNPEPIDPRMKWCVLLREPLSTRTTIQENTVIPRVH